MIRRLIILAVLLLGILSVAILNRHGTVNANDVGVYRNIAEQIQRVWEGPQATLQSEYPPLPSSFFWMVEHSQVERSFGDRWFVIITGILLLTPITLTVVFGLLEGIAVAAMILFAILLLGPDITFARYDVYVLLPLLLSWRFYRRGYYGWSSFWLTLAGCIKIIPFAALPLLPLLLPRKHWWKLLLGAVIAGTISLSLPLLILGWDMMWQNLDYMSYYHTLRGVQVETIWSSSDLLRSALRGITSPVSFQAGSHQNNNLGDATKLIGLVLGLLGLLGVFAMTWFHGRKATERDFFLPMAIALLWLLAIGTVLSPQYFVWVLPITGLWVGERLWESWKASRRDILGVVIAILCIVIALATQRIYPHAYSNIVNQNSLIDIFILNTRNILTFVLVCALSLAWSRDVERTTLRA